MSESRAGKRKDTDKNTGNELRNKRAREVFINPQWPFSIACNRNAETPVFSSQYLERSLRNVPHCEFNSDSEDDDTCGRIKTHKLEPEGSCGLVRDLSEPYLRKRLKPKHRLSVQSAKSIESAGHRVKNCVKNMKVSCADCSSASFESEQSLKRHLLSHVEENQLSVCSSVKVSSELQVESLSVPHDFVKTTFDSYSQQPDEISLSPVRLAETSAESSPQTEIPSSPHSPVNFSVLSYKQDESKSDFNDPITALTESLLAKHAENPLFPYRSTKFSAEYNEKHAANPASKHLLKCKYCFVKFDQYSDFKIHMKLHPSEGLLSCALCPYKSTYQLNMEDHVLNNHSCVNILMCM